MAVCVVDEAVQPDVLTVPTSDQPVSPVMDEPRVVLSDIEIIFVIERNSVSLSGVSILLLRVVFHLKIGI